jgi:hypothetical protein
VKQLPDGKIPCSERISTTFSDKRANSVNCHQCGGSLASFDFAGLKTGQVTPIISDVKTPKGLLFVPADGGNDDGQNVDSSRHR